MIDLFVNSVRTTSQTPKAIYDQVISESPHGLGGVLPFSEVSQALYKCRQLARPPLPKCLNDAVRILQVT
jgi:hypothetical protein